jgi:hypothetical protein
MIAASLVLLAQTQAQEPASVPEYERDVRPILAAHCYECHGDKRQRGALRLDRRTPRLFELQRGRPAVLMAGSASASPLYQRVVSADPDERMPLEQPPLSAAQVDTLRRWIDAGAAWPEADASTALESQVQTLATHWAYHPPQPPSDPALQDASWVRQPLDGYVLANLAAHRLAPSPRAPSGEWLRRAALDLTGLPPTLAELDAFEHKAAADWNAATAAAVDVLLASPRYGERMAQWWLDLARYADTHGYEKDAPRSVWPWRDWVIGAFQRDVPFDQFTLEQLAGDLLPEPTREQLVATGFHRNTLINEEGGTDDEEFRVAAVIDRANTTAQVWLGSTLACAQCHNHKYDPFSQREYYEFYAFFDQTEDGGKKLDPLLEVPSAEQASERDRLRAELELARTALVAEEPAIDARQRVWEERARAEVGPAPAWTQLRFDAHSSASSAELRTANDGRIRASGALVDEDEYVLRVQPSGAVITALRLDALPDSDLPQGGASRADNANFALTEFRLWRAAWERDALTIREAPFAAADSDRRQAGTSSSPANAIDDVLDTHWIVDGPAPASLVAALAEPFVLKLDDSGTQGYRAIDVVLEFRSPWPHHQLGSFRVSVTDDLRVGDSLPHGKHGELGYPWHVRDTLRVPSEQRSDAQLELLRSDFRTRVDARAKELKQQVDAAQKALDELQSKIPTTPVLRERKEPRTTHVLGKGSFLAPLDEVRPDVPAVLPPLPADAPRNRLGLARWLVARENPLTARVIANRLWERLFGRGIVATLDDFGTRGDAPANVELLEHLALRLVELDWSLQRFQRELVLSSTYAQSSRVSPTLAAEDALNVQLARASRPRLEIETLRDQALSIAGLLVEQVGGPSVRPPQPVGAESHVYSDDHWVDASGPDRYRRGLYTFWKRSSPYGTFATFDAPSREQSCTRRARTNTPLQALALLNDPAFDECARAFGARLLSETSAAAGDATAADDRARLASGFRRCTARAPNDAELERLIALLAAERSAVLALDAQEREPTVWARIATVLLNLDDTLCRN